MPEKVDRREDLSLDDSVKKSKRGEVILGRLFGPVADFINATRNGRKYDEALWEKVFSNDIVREYFKSGGIPGELDHPADRAETKSSEIAIMMPDPPEKDEDGHLIAHFDILDTPNGRITYTLAKYGYKLGISSRGNGDVYEDMDGNECVDGDTYDFQAFDVVLLPAVKAARMTFTESLDEKGMGFKKAICESLEKSNEDERKVMKETLDRLGITYNTQSGDYIEQAKEEAAAEDSGARLFEELQAALVEKKSTEAKVVSLQEQLSARYARESELEEEATEMKAKVQKLSEELSKATAAANALKTRVEALSKSENELKESLKDRGEAVLRLQEQRKRSVVSGTNLQESLSSQNQQLEKLKEKVTSLNESISAERTQMNKTLSDKEKEVSQLKESISKQKSSYTAKIEKANKLVEKYKSIAIESVDKYIATRAIQLGVTANEVKSRLAESYTFEDIDKVCEDLQRFKVNMAKLPIGLEAPSKVSKVRVTKSREPIIPAGRFDDEVDSSLLRMAGLD